jgi:hypothetical protein
MHAEKSRFSLDRIALTAILLVAAVLVIGDFRVVLANSSADDSPVLFGRFFEHPERFQTDLLGTYGYIYGLGTAVHWLPALLYRTVRVPLELSAYLITVLQTVLLGIALYRLTRLATGDSWKAWLCVCFALAAEVYAWNLSNYASQMQSPYAGHLVLPFVVFGMTEWVKSRARASALWLSAAALIHPTLTLVTIGLLVGRVGWRWNVPRKAALWLLLPAALSVLPPLFVQQRFGGELSSSIVADLMRANMHMNPFPFARIYTTVLPTLAMFTALVLLGAWRSKSDDRYRALAIDTIIYTALLGVAHFIATKLSIALVMTFVPLRFSSVMLVFCLPLVISYLADGLNDGRLVKRWSSALLLIVPPISGMGVLTGSLIATAADDTKGRRAGALVFAVWLAAALIAFWAGVPDRIETILLAVTLPGSRIDPVTFTLAVSIGGLIAWLALVRPESVRGPAQMALAAVLAAVLLLNSARKGARTLEGEQRDLYDAQSWARENTADTALFLLEPNIAWRVGADRPVIEATAPPLHVYSRSQDAYDRIAARKQMLRERPWVTEAAVLEFARQFGGQYLVRYAERPPAFEPVYRNETYAIYRLPTAPASQPQ